jgi:predicted metalloprotease with PDZ domain
VVRYVVRADVADRSGFAVEMRLRNAPDTLHLRLPVWAPGAYRLAGFASNVRDLAVVDAAGKSVSLSPESVDGDTTKSAGAWRAIVPGGAATVRYRVAFPSPAAAATPNNRSFFRETGLLLDGPATYLYLDGQKLAPAHVTLDLPAGWRVATGLVPTADARTYFAPSYDVLIDSPVLAGPAGGPAGGAAGASALHVWPFDVDGVPHRIAYWATPGAPAFDSAAFVAAHARIVAAARDVAGRLPYRDYTFIYVDSTGGGLEHLNSTTIGARAAALARDPLAAAATTAHEYFHLWNVKRLRPAALGPFDYQHPVRTTSLWWSEGVTDFFAAELQRRAALVSEAQARDELAGTIQAFLANPAHAVMSPESASWVAWDSPSTYGGYTTGFYYTQGALLGELLELRIRRATGLRRGMDDVLRLLLDRFAGARGFAGEDILYAANEACGCDLQPFFGAHVSGADSLDLDRELAPLGWRATVERRTATDAAGVPAPDLRVGIVAFGGTGSAGGAAGGRARFSVGSPASAWGRAGLVTGDEAVSVRGRPVATGADLAAALAGAKVGDTVRVEYVRAGERRAAAVVLAPYETVRVTLADLPSVSAAQRAMRRVWMSGGR